jgi:hypothetical protein
LRPANPPGPPQSPGGHAPSPPVHSGYTAAASAAAEAVSVHRAEFERRTLHQDYSRLRDTAERAGQWPELREWALEYLRGRAQVKEFYVRELISVLIRGELPDEAWTTAVAAPGQVPEQQWLELIGLREPGHPADVIGPLRDLIELGIERTSDKYRYPKALKRLRDDYQRAGGEAGFTTYLDELRKRQRRNASFMAKLEVAFAQIEAPQHWYSASIGIPAVSEVGVATYAHDPDRSDHGVCA